MRSVEFIEHSTEVVSRGLSRIPLVVAGSKARSAISIVSGTHHIYIGYIGRVVAAASLDQHALLYRDGLFRKLAAGC
ncbi:hypothetical protein JQ597_26415 [Bradyrhizobium sp. AUGA SZCCT0177]|uniref:hypothetical protein n=1 Tax=Bradyrhizobium sp. AUGA SZCCT0177 TaxID=2807665 RepID=UPI001BAE1A67|nr:hypothetical protein [Bradyrhizobium sp. AUGA SZCCT0177]MBR1285590.1 hypothetical protein [Bradyrhizobium sp. AUGA SZCCT0177]